ERIDLARARLALLGRFRGSVTDLGPSQIGPRAVLGGRRWDPWGARDRCARGGFDRVRTEPWQLGDDLRSGLVRRAGRRGNDDRDLRYARTVFFGRVDTHQRLHARAWERRLRRRSRRGRHGWGSPSLAGLGHHVRRGGSVARHLRARLVPRAGTLRRG